MDAKISYSMEYAGWDAAIAAGATLTELERWDRREFAKEFMAKVVAWHQNHIAIGNHLEDAARPKRGK